MKIRPQTPYPKWTLFSDLTIDINSLQYQTEYMISEGNYRNTFTKQNVSKPAWHRHIFPSVMANTYKYWIINTQNWSNFASGSPSLPATCSCFFVLMRTCSCLIFTECGEFSTSLYKLATEDTEPRHTTKHQDGWCQMWLC